MTASTAVVLAGTERSVPESIRGWLRAGGLEVVELTDETELVLLCLRSRPRLAILDGRRDLVRATRLCSRLKADSYTGVVPTVIICPSVEDALAECFRAGADEVIPDGMRELEVKVRLDAVVRRSDRDVQVHPSTRLPGTVAIEAEIARRLAAGAPFGVCYADLDHFKEYNDRYSYYEGDRVIRVVARVLHDIVKGLCGETGFVGHIGGDDFIFIIPAEAVQAVCEETVLVFDLLAPYQYSESDRRAGYFFGKDRRGQLHRVPLMTLSIGVVTSERRHFTTALQVSELATEMKGFAKTLPGSVFSIDRRQEHVTPSESTPRASPQQPIGVIHD